MSDTTLPDQNNKGAADSCVRIAPGICGFECRVRAHKVNSRLVTLAISESECRQIQMLANRLTEMSLKDLFLPLTRNPVYIAAEKSGCHPSCAVPCAVLKAAEAAMGMALPHAVQIDFENC